MVSSGKIIDLTIGMILLIGVLLQVIVETLATPSISGNLTGISGTVAGFLKVGVVIVALVLIFRLAQKKM